MAAALAAALLPSAPAAADTPPLRPYYVWTESPSKVWVHRPDGGYLQAKPWSYCWTGPQEDGESVTVCVDGVPPERDEMRRLASANATRFWFGRPGWDFEATLTSLSTPDDEACRSHMAAERRKPRWFRVARPERPGVYRVELAGQGPEGDVSVAFKWRVGRWDSVTAC